MSLRFSTVALIAGLTLAAATPAHAATITNQQSVTVGGQMMGMALTLDGSALWVADANGNRIVELTTGPNPQVARSIAMRGTAPSSITMMPDGVHAIVTCAFSHSVELVDMVNGTTEDLGNLYGLGAMASAVSPDGQYVVVGYMGDNSVARYRVSDWTQMDQWTGLGQIVSVAYSPDGSFISAVSNSDSKVYILRAGDPSTAQQLTVGTNPWGQVYSRDGSKLLVAASVAQATYEFTVADLNASPRVRVAGAPILYANYSPDGNEVWMPQWMSGTMRISDNSTWDTMQTVSLPGNPREVLFSADGCQGFVSQQLLGAITVFDLDTCNPVEPSPSTSPAPAATGSLATTGVDGSLAALVAAMLAVAGLSLRRGQHVVSREG